MTIGENIKKARGRIKQSELAEMLNVDVSTISRWENDKNIPNSKVLKKIAEILNTTVSYLSGENEEIVSDNAKSQQDSENNITMFMTPPLPPHLSNLPRGKGEINGNPYYMGQGGFLYFPGPPSGMSFWGQVLDAAEAAVVRANKDELSRILPLVRDAYNIISQGVSQASSK